MGGGLLEGGWGEGGMLGRWQPPSLPLVWNGAEVAEVPMDLLFAQR
jgi:hypothetical protein